MNCTKCEILLHPLIDGELDAGHISEVETHVATCSGCTGKLKTFRAMRETMAGADLKWTAPAHLRRRIEAALPLPIVSASAQIVAPRKFLQPSRRTFFGGFAVGTALSAALAASVVLTVFTHDQEQTIANEVASAHIRSLQPGHLMDVISITSGERQPGRPPQAFRRSKGAGAPTRRICYRRTCAFGGEGKERDRPDCSDPRAPRSRIWPTSTSRGGLRASG